MAQVKASLQVVIDPEFLAALEQACAALERLRQISERDDLVTIIDPDVRIEQ